MQVIKIVLEGTGDVRRLQIPLSTVEVLKSTIKDTFKIGDNFSVKYVDNEGDIVTIDNTADLQEAARIYANSVLKINVTVRKTSEKQVQPNRHTQTTAQTVDSQTQQTREYGTQNIPQYRFPCGPDAFLCGPGRYQCGNRKWSRKWNSGSKGGGCFFKMIGFFFVLKLLFGLGCCPLFFLPLLFFFLKTVCCFVGSHLDFLFLTQPFQPPASNTPNNINNPTTKSPSPSAPSVSSTDTASTPEPSAPSAPKDNTKYSDQQQLLKKLGFGDERLNSHLLEAYNGNFQAAVDHLSRN
jgi:hypothetical protein